MISLTSSRPAAIREKVRKTIKNPAVTAPATGLDMSRETDVARVDQRDSQDDRRLTFFRMGNEEERAKSGYSPHLPAGCR